MLNKIQEWLKSIKDHATPSPIFGDPTQLIPDPEMAHAEEDALYEWFITQIANDTDCKYSAAAKEVLTSQDIDFPRWCA